jgi:hypothetical protein
MENRQLNELEPFGEPDCESEIELLGEGEYKKYYFSHTRFNNASVDKKVFLIVGRRGSGKTALSHFFSFQDFMPNSIAIDVNEPAAFQQLMSKISSSAAQSREVAIPRLVKIWEYIIWEIIFRQLENRDPRIKAACVFANDKGKVSHFIRNLLKDLINKYLKTDDDLSDELEEIISNKTIQEAKNAVLEISKNTPIILAFDTLENYTLKDEAMMRGTAALIQCASEFTRNFVSRNIYIKLFVMAEIFPHLKEEVILNTLKFVRDEVYLHWNPKDLMRLVSWRFWHYLRVSNLVADQNINWDDHKEVLQEIWFPFFGRDLINGGGLQEMSFPYVLRHTQMRPRQLIVLCNQIAKSAIESDNFPNFTPKNLIDGIMRGEEKLADEVFNSYQSVYPNAAKIADALSGIPQMFKGKELDRRAKITSSHWTEDYSLNNFRQFVSELGIVGRVRSHSTETGIVEADFEYTLHGRLPLIPEDTCVIHPMFYKRLNVQINQKLKVYPFPDHQDFRELKYNE